MPPPNSFVKIEIIGGESPRTDASAFAQLRIIPAVQLSVMVRYKIGVEVERHRRCKGEFISLCSVWIPEPPPDRHRCMRCSPVRENQRHKCFRKR